jgi:tetratricopeptide (TPR) repeat protein
MTQFRKLARGSLLAAAGLCAFAFVGTGLSSIAEAKKTKAAAEAGENSKLSPEEQKKQLAQQSYDAGLKNFANGRYEQAVEQLSTALKTGGLAQTAMAKALFTRGLAYKKQKQPGLAISDLTSALWLKNGLSESDRKTATAERAEAYSMAGVQDSGKGPERVVGAATPASPAPATPPTAVPASGPNAGSAGLSAAAIAQAAANSHSSNESASNGSVTRQDPSSATAQEAARARAAYAPVKSLAGSTVTSGGPQAAPATQTQTAAPSSSFGSGVTGFFSNMFGGGTSTTSAQGEAPAGVTTASTAPAGSVPETSSWSNATVVNEGHSASKPSAVVAAKTTKATKGKYKVHIAAMRSRADAEALAQRLIAQHGADLDNHVPTVDEAVIGSMGTFYRVRIGGYASQEEPRGLCNKLRTSGLDCLVVTN